MQKHPRHCAANQGWQFLPRISWTFLMKPKSPHSDWGTLETELPCYNPSPNTHTYANISTHTGKTTCLLLSSGRGPGPQAMGPPCPGLPHFLKDKSCRGLGSPTNPSSKHASQTAPFTPQRPLQVNKAWEEPGNKTSLVQQGQPLPSGPVGRKPVATPMSPASSAAGLPKTWVFHSSGNYPWPGKGEKACELRDPLPPQWQPELFSWWGLKVAPGRGTGLPEQN